MRSEASRNHKLVQTAPGTGDSNSQVALATRLAQATQLFG